MADAWASLLARAAGHEPDTTQNTAPEPVDLQPTLPNRKRKATKAFRRWCKQSHTLMEHNLLALLDEAEETGQVVKIENFLDPLVAEGCLQALQAAPTASWSVAQTKTDTELEGQTQHQYGEGDGGDEGSESKECVDAICACLQGLQPGVQGFFQAGRYTRGSFIEPHDDAAFKEIEGKLHKRSIAVIFYLTQNWTEDFGGSFVDLQGGVSHVPLFNSVVAFRVPRRHEVEVVKTDRARLSIFGWFYVPCEAEPVKRKASDQHRKKKKRKKMHAVQ